MSTISRNSDNSTDKRIRGRRAVKLRKQRLLREPLCRHCREKGRISRATVPDHIIPLAFGGTETDDNIQCLCQRCHAIKTAHEAALGFGAATHPEWLKPSAIPLTIVCGPPASGKTTYIKDRASGADLIIDIDMIARDIEPAYQHWRGMLQGALLTRVIRVRNALLASLCRARRDRAWFIVSAPYPAERTWWQGKLGGEVVLLDPGMDECVRRSTHRGTSEAIPWIGAWYRKSIQPWRCKSISIGVDGWPVS